MTRPHLRHLLDDLAPRRRPSRTLFRASAVFLAAAAIHLLPLALDGWHWTGAVSFRKPIVFLISIGLLLATVGWVLDRLPNRARLANTLAWSLLVSSTVEVSLITVQSWRGRASHFNVLAPTDAAVFAGMGIAVAVMSLCLVGLLVWSLVEPPADRLVRTAVVGGLALVMTGLGIGQWMIELGNDFVASTRSVPDVVTVGPSGHPKFPHALAFHGIQVFVVVALLLRRTVLARPERSRTMWTMVASYTALLVLASLQAVLGHAPSQLTPWSLAMAAVAAGMAATGIRILRSLPADEPAPVADAAASR